MRVQETRRRSRYVLLVLTLVAVTLITLDSRGVPIFDGVRNVALESRSEDEVLPGSRPARAT